MKPAPIEYANVDFTAALARVVEASAIETRPYQGRIGTRALESFLAKGMRSVLIESATGSGKTITALTTLRAMADLMKPVLGREVKIGWVAMRRNLLAQAMRENQEKGINAPIVPISMFDKTPPADLDILCVDECQHDAADSMVHIHNVTKPKYVIGLTATPFRTDSVKLCFDTVIKDAGIGQLILDGYLSKYDHFTIPEHSPRFVTKVFLQDPTRWGKSLMFFHTLDQCADAMRRLKRGKIKCDVVTGSIDRESQLELFEANELQVLINCMVLTEGFDAPDLRSVFCRPSCKSVTMQMAGRAFRKHASVPVKQVIQCKRTKWPFIRTAKANQQHLYNEHGEFVALSAGENIDRISHNTIRALAHINTRMPKFFSDKKKGRGRRPRFNQGDQ